MEQDQMQAETPSYWPSVIIGALVVTIVTSVIVTAYLYYLASAEPSMGLLIKSGLMMPISCLFGLLGGIISTRHYAKTNEITFAIGKGALIGLYTGLVASVFSLLLSQLWQFIDPALMENFSNNLIEAMGSANMPEAQYNETVDKMRADFANQQTLVGVLKGGAINAAVLGIVNAISGMIGAKIFASPEEE